MNRDLISVRRVIKQTNMLIETDIPQAVEVATSAVLMHRNYLENYVKRNSLFLSALEPVEVEAHAPEVVQRMARAALMANVGPIAGVAGVLADLAFEAMLKVGARVRVVENGGEIAAVSELPEVLVVVRVHAGSSPLSGKIRFLLPLDVPIGVATSSGTSGRVISFGKADSATVFADNAVLADAAATAVCNSVKGHDVEESIRRGLDFAKSIQGVRGALIIRGKHAGTVGELPPLVGVRPNEFCHT